MKTRAQTAHRRPGAAPEVSPTPRFLALFLSGTLLLATAMSLGCTGVTSAKGNSVTSTNQNTAQATGKLTASPAAPNFSNVSVGSTSNQSLTITNSGTSSVTISQASASGTGFSIGGVGLPLNLSPGVSATFTVSFAPSSMGSVSGAASFIGTPLNSPFVVQMSGTAVAVAPSINAQPISQSILVGQTATFFVTASGTAPLSYQWRKSGATISGATSASYTTPVETISDNGAQFSVIVNNSAGTVTSNGATLTVTTSPVAPSITTQPANQTIFAGQTATFSVVANGTLPLTYQWLKNGTAISGATSSSYMTPAEMTSDSGALFSVVVSNSAGSATSNNAGLTVNPDPVAPSITSQPASQTITVGQTATFSVGASGTAPLSYQWQKNGSAIAGAISSTYTTPAETISDSGAQFAVVVSNSAGSTTSNTAVLTVNAVAPSITTQPASRTITAGQTATFSVTASGTAPLNYQWSKNATAISGATSSSYTTPAETTSDNGAQFTVAVANTAGNVTSNAATLTVNPATPGALTPSTTSLGFGNVTINTSNVLSVTFTNSGSVNITVSTVTISGAGLTASGISNGQIINPGQVVTLNVTFAPVATGNVIGNVTIASNASNSPSSISLTGGGTLAHTVMLNWTASTSTVIGYNVYRGIASGGPYAQVNSSLVSGTQYADSSVVSGQTYFYVATAVASGNVESSDSNQASAVIPVP
jgi:uncharacterized protein DUF1573/ASPM-SPD-2-Hydin domain-containing protein/immunoglobulin I-set domain protein